MSHDELEQRFAMHNAIIEERERCARVCAEFAAECLAESNLRAADGLHDDAKEFAERATAAHTLAMLIRRGRG